MALTANMEISESKQATSAGNREVDDDDVDELADDDQQTRPASGPSQRNDVLTQDESRSEITGQGVISEEGRLPCQSIGMPFVSSMSNCLCSHRRWL